MGIDYLDIIYYTQKKVKKNKIISKICRVFKSVYYEFGVTEFSQHDKLLTQIYKDCAILKSVKFISDIITVSIKKEKEMCTDLIIP